jgi:hypothetical protein
VGRLEPEEAEEWARELAVAPLASSPDPAKFDPMLEPDWSLGMTLAWIMMRDVDAVRNVGDKWREARHLWRRRRVPDHPNQISWRLDTAPPAPLMDLHILEANASEANVLVMSVEEAETDLWRRLKSGELRASGLPMNGGIREAIHPHRWHELRLYEESGKLTVKDDPIMRSGFREVAISSSEIQKLWPLAKRKRGRRSKFDWIRFDQQALQILDDEGDFDATVDPRWNQAALEERMTKWCSLTWGEGNEPVESTIRKHIKSLVARFRENRMKADN